MISFHLHSNVYLHDCSNHFRNLAEKKNMSLGVKYMYHRFTYISTILGDEDTFSVNSYMSISEDRVVLHSKRQIEIILFLQMAYFRELALFDITLWSVLPIYHTKTYRKGTVPHCFNYINIQESFNFSQARDILNTTWDATISPVNPFEPTFKIASTVNLMLHNLLRMLFIFSINIGFHAFKCVSCGKLALLCDVIIHRFLLKMGTWKWWCRVKKWRVGSWVHAFVYRCQHYLYL